MGVFSKLLRRPAPRASADRNWDAPPVASSLSLAQLEAAARGGIDPSVLSTFGIQVGFTKIPLGFPALLRCVSLISSLMAQLVTCGSLRAVDQSTGETVDRPSVRRTVRELQDGVAGEMLPAYTFFEALASDLLLYGNALAKVERSPLRLTRLEVGTATTERGSTGARVYRASEWGEANASRETLAPRDVVHARWGSLIPSVASEDSYHSGFASSVLQLIRSPLAVGEAAEAYVQSFFRYGATSAPWAIVMEDTITEEQDQEIKRRLRERAPREGLILGDLGEKGQVVRLDTEPQRASTGALRSYQVQEIARAYGMPAPLVGVDVTSWGSGIAELGRFAWRYGVRQHLDRLLSSLSHVLLPAGVRFDVDPLDLVRGSPEALVGVSQAIMGGPNANAIGSLKEARRMLGLPPDVDGELSVYTPTATEGAPPSMEGDE